MFIRTLPRKGLHISPAPPLGRQGLERKALQSMCEVYRSPGISNDQSEPKQITEFQAEGTCIPHPGSSELRRRYYVGGPTPQKVDKITMIGGVRNGFDTYGWQATQTFDLSRRSVRFVLIPMHRVVAHLSLQENASVEPTLMPSPL